MNSVTGSGAVPLGRKSLMASKPRLANPWLEWGRTSKVHGKAVEVPWGWEIRQPRARGDKTSAWVYHRDVGIGIDANNRQCVVELVQEGVSMQAGVYALRLDITSHLELKEGDAKFKVLFQVADGPTYDSEEMFVTETKGPQSRTGKVTVAADCTGTLIVRYETVWASTRGEVQLRGVVFDERGGGQTDFALKVGSEEVTQPVTVTGTKIDLWRYMVPPAERRQQTELNTSAGREFVRRMGAASGHERGVKRGVLMLTNQYWRHWLLKVVGETEFACLGADCSMDGGTKVFVPSTDGYYDENGENYGQPWLPRWCSVGQRHVQTSYNVVLTHAGKELKRPEPQTDYYELHALHDNYHVRQSGKTLTNVAEIHWWRGKNPDTAQPDEKYWFARGMGIVGHWNRHGWSSHFVREQGPGHAEAYGFPEPTRLGFYVPDLPEVGPGPLVLPEEPEDEADTGVVLYLSTKQYSELLRDLQAMDALRESVLSKLTRP